MGTEKMPIGPLVIRDVSLKSGIGAFSVLYTEKIALCFHRARKGKVLCTWLPFTVVSHAPRFSFRMVRTWREFVPSSAPAPRNSALELPCFCSSYPFFQAGKAIASLPHFPKATNKMSHVKHYIHNKHSPGN